MVLQRECRCNVGGEATVHRTIVLQRADALEAPPDIVAFPTFGRLGAMVAFLRNTMPSMPHSSCTGTWAQRRPQPA